MRTTPNPGERDGASLAGLARLIEEETRALLSESLAPAHARQWQASPVPTPREDTAERSSGGAPPNPTADVALDGRRLALRERVRDAERALAGVDNARRGLANVLAQIRDARRELDRAIRRFDGEGR